MKTGSSKTKGSGNSSVGAPLVSVVIPCYNHEAFVRDCIESVIAQDYENIELIVIDDGSTDLSVERITQLIPACEKRFVRFSFHSRENKGLSATLNEAIQWCRGRYFSTIASDDVMLPQKTSTLLKHIENEENLAGVFSGCYLIDVNGIKISVAQPPTGVFSFEDIILRRRNLLAPTQLLRLDSLKEVGGYREDLYIEDFYMWLALTQNGLKVRVIDGLLVEYRQHGSNSSNDPLKMYNERIKVLNYFSASPLYKESMAANCLAGSFFLTATSKVLATRLLIQSVSHYKKIVLYPWFIKSCIRIVVPRSLVVHAKNLREALVGDPTLVG